MSRNFGVEELRKIIKEGKFQNEFISQFLDKVPTFDEALDLSLKFKISLHPKYLYFWEQISLEEFNEILQPTKIQEKSIQYLIKCKPILEKLGVPHEVQNKPCDFSRYRSKNFL